VTAACIQDAGQEVTVIDDEIGKDQLRWGCSRSFGLTFLHWGTKLSASICQQQAGFSLVHSTPGYGEMVDLLALDLVSLAIAICHVHTADFGAMQ
jgi:hypothetical protein